MNTGIRNITDVSWRNITISNISGINASSNANTAVSSVSAALDTQSSLLIFAFILIFLIGVIGNTFVCYFFGWKRRGHRTRTVPDKLFLYLGVVDLLSSCFNPLIYIYFEYTKYSRWDFGKFGCKLLVPLGPISTTLSSFLIQIIAIDRYFVILSPFGRRYSSKPIDRCVILAVILSILLYLHYIWMLEIPVSGGTCRVFDTTDKRYSVPTICSMLIQDSSLMFVILFTTIKIIRKLKNEDELNTLGRLTGKQQKSHKKLMRMLLVIACVFIILTFPRDAFHLSFTFSWMFPPGITYNSDIQKINAFLKIMSVSNSCANVFIYSKMHKKFRISVFSFFPCCNANDPQVKSYRHPDVGKRLCDSTV